MEADLMNIRISVALHIVVAIFMGWFSVVVSSIYGYGDWLTILLGLIILWALGKVTNKVVGKKGFKWWFSNGVIIYLFVWLISWILFCNLMGVC